MAQQDHDIYGVVAARMEQSIRQACPTCGRGAMNLAQPTVEDLEALLDIKQGFDRVRRDFTPQMEQKLQSLERVANYLHTMIAGGQS